jgi:multidrug resistance efflux pump
MKMNQMIQRLRSRIMIDNTTRQEHLIESMMRVKIQRNQGSREQI